MARSSTIRTSIRARRFRRYGIASHLILTLHTNQAPNRVASIPVLWGILSWMRPQSSRLYNKDLAPTNPEQRTWGTYNFAALWISMAHCIPTYMLASGLIGAGMSWRQALGTILLGNTIVLVPILLNSHAGTKHGIPFPVFARAAYGTFGSNVPALMRALVACGWFGIQAWIGGQALHVFFRSVWPGWAAAIPGSFGGHTATEWISFLLFWRSEERRVGKEGRSRWSP